MPAKKNPESPLILHEKPVEATGGIIVGNFMPLHKGHEYLIDFARSYVDKLLIVLLSSKNEPISSQTRIQWLTEMFPDCQIILAGEASSSVESLSELLKGKYKTQFVFGSCAEDRKLADALSACYIPVDPERAITPISSQQIRQDPLTFWEYLPSCVRPYFVKKVCVFGPESTGKSTLTANLAAHFKSVCVPEYARTFMDSRDNELKLEDFPNFARGHVASEKALSRQANRVIFSDTDLLITTIWSTWLYDSCDPWIAQEAEKQQYDLYLLTDVDVPWVLDPQRYLPEERQSFLDRCIKELDSRNRSYVLISGSWEARLAKAIAAVDDLLRR